MLLVAVGLQVLQQAVAVPVAHPAHFAHVRSLTRVGDLVAGQVVAAHEGRRADIAYVGPLAWRAIRKCVDLLVYYS